ncbi:MAG TPA: hypothetical protein VK509_22485 [Polyangiales bacterium]|nr:hypothetical protein [Polyangiales bacterium]
MPIRPRLLLALGCALLASSARPAAAQRANPDDPYRYDLRAALFPVAFVAGVSQSSFGSGLRGEIDASRRLVLQLSGRLPWLEVAGQKERAGFALRAGLMVHFFDEVEQSELSNTVTAHDAAAPGQRRIGTDRDADRKIGVPTSDKLGSPRMSAGDRREGRAPVRHVQSLRLGYDLTRAVERARPPIPSKDPRIELNEPNGETRYELNTLHSLSLGYGFGSHWNISPATAGEREVGWRRFYIDALLTLEPLVDHEPIAGADRIAAPSDFVPVGVRIGMEGAIEALLRGAPGVGFAYNLELGALPGYSGLEGYLLVGIGLALDFSTRY